VEETIIQKLEVRDSFQGGFSTRVLDGGGIYGSEVGCAGVSIVRSDGMRIDFSLISAGSSGNLYSALSSFQGRMLTLISMFIFSPLRSFSVLDYKKLRF